VAAAERRAAPGGLRVADRPRGPRRSQPPRQRGSVPLPSPGGAAAMCQPVRDRGRVRRSRHPACGSVPAAIARRCACRAYDVSACDRDRRPGKAQPPPGEITAQSSISLFAMRLAGLQLLCDFRTDCAPDMSSALCLSWRRERTGGGQSPPPPVPRAPASKIAAARYLRLIPAGFGSGRGSVRAKHGPQPASMRAAPAFRERLSDFEAVSTGSFSRASG
jgi:hypothetical protein